MWCQNWYCMILYYCFSSRNRALKIEALYHIYHTYCTTIPSACMYDPLGMNHKRYEPENWPLQSLQFGEAFSGDVESRHITTSSAGRSQLFAVALFIFALFVKTFQFSLRKNPRVLTHEDYCRRLFRPSTRSKRDNFCGQPPDDHTD